jgi:tetratricopeptide (TPR) repeat protein
MGWLGRHGAHSKPRAASDLESLSSIEIGERLRLVAQGQPVPGLDSKRPLNEQLETLCLSARSSLEERERDEGWRLGVCRLGDAWASLGCDDEALEAFSLAAEVSPDPLDRARIGLDRALALGRLGRFEEAVEACEEAAEEAGERDPSLRARCELRRGGALLETHAHKDAIAACISAREVFVAGGEPVEAARCDMLQAIALARLGYPVKAIGIFEITSKSFRRHGEHVDAAVCILNRGAALGNLFRRKQDDVVEYVRARAPIVNERHIDPSQALVWAIGGFVQATDIFRAYGREDHLKSCTHLLEIGLRTLMLYRPNVRSWERYSVCFADQYHENYHKLLEESVEPMVASDRAAGLADGHCAVRC